MLCFGNVIMSSMLLHVVVSFGIHLELSNTLFIIVIRFFTIDHSECDCSDYVSFKRKASTILTRQIHFDHILLLFVFKYLCIRVVCRNALIGLLLVLMLAMIDLLAIGLPLP